MYPYAVGSSLIQSSMRSTAGGSSFTPDITTATTSASTVTTSAPRRPDPAEWGTGTGTGTGDDQRYPHSNHDQPPTNVPAFSAPIARVRPHPPWLELGPGQSSYVSDDGNLNLPPLSHPDGINPQSRDRLEGTTGNNPTTTTPVSLPSIHGIARDIDEYYLRLIPPRIPSLPDGLKLGCGGVGVGVGGDETTSSSLSSASASSSTKPPPPYMFPPRGSCSEAGSGSSTPSKPITQTHIVVDNHPTPASASDSLSSYSISKYRPTGLTIPDPSFNINISHHPYPYPHPHPHQQPHPHRHPHPYPQQHAWRHPQENPFQSTSSYSHDPHGPPHWVPPPNSMEKAQQQQQQQQQLHHLTGTVRASSRESLDRDRDRDPDPDPHAGPVGLADGSTSSADQFFPESAQKRRGKHPQHVTNILRNWLMAHTAHPYPTDDEKKRFCELTNLSMSQVSNWFINARRRILVHPAATTATLAANNVVVSHSHGSHSPKGGPHHHHHHHHHHHDSMIDGGGHGRRYISGQPPFPTLPPPSHSSTMQTTPRPSQQTDVCTSAGGCGGGHVSSRPHLSKLTFDHPGAGAGGPNHFPSQPQSQSQSQSPSQSTGIPTPSPTSHTSWHEEDDHHTAAAAAASSSSSTLDLPHEGSVGSYSVEGKLGGGGGGGQAHVGSMIGGGVGEGCQYRGSGHSVYRQHQQYHGVNPAYHPYPSNFSSPTISQITHYPGSPYTAVLRRPSSYPSLAYTHPHTHTTQASEYPEQPGL